MNSLGDWRIHAETNELRRADNVVRVKQTQAQGLLTLVSSGIGPLVGAGACGWVRFHLVTADGPRRDAGVRPGAARE